MFAFSLCTGLPTPIGHIQVLRQYVTILFRLFKSFDIKCRSSAGWHDRLFERFTWLDSEQYY